MNDELFFDPEAPLQPPLSTDPGDIRAEMFSAMRELNPGWVDLPLAGDTLTMSAIAEAAAAGRQAWVAQMTVVLTELLGALNGIPRLTGFPATSTITVTALDTLGHSEPAGLTVYVGDIETITIDELIVPPGSTTATVQIAAVETTAAANGATGDVQISPLDWLATVDPVVLDAPLSGGQDPQTTSEYQIYLLQELAVPRRAVRSEDFVLYARRHPAVGICWGLPNYRPADAPGGEATDVLLTYTVVVGTANGADPGADARAEILADLQSRTLENIDIYVRSIALQSIDVTAIVKLKDDADPDVALPAAQSAIEAALDPSGWWARAFGIGTPDDVVHESRLVAAAQNIDAVVYVDDLELNDGSAPSITLGPLTLPAPGTVEVTAV